MTETLKIGEVARRAGVTVDLVRFYERRGVLPAPSRRASGYRQYSDATVERIRFAKSLQALSFTLDEIADVLRSVDNEVASCERERPRFEAVLARVDQKIGELTTIRRGLLATLKRCRDGSCMLVEDADRARSATSKPGRVSGTSERRVGSRHA
ncbi:MAG TPA: MerR family transcriptional regulator [Polyangiaceae bacterium]|nr:MerR family transcriptional regulator [Polyangiaceae bacterium]